MKRFGLLLAFTFVFSLVLVGCEKSAPKSETDPKGEKKDVKPPPPPPPPPIPDKGKPG